MSNLVSSPARSRGSHSSSSSRSPLERKESLRMVLDMTKTLHNVDVTTVKELEKMIKHADEINQEATIEEKVVGHDEVLMDSEVMVASSRVLKISACSLTKEISPYNTRDFAEKLLQYVQTIPDEIPETNWSMLETEVSKIFKKTPNYTTICGCLESVEPKVVVKRQHAKRDALAPIKRPDAIVEVGNDEDSVEGTVSKIKKLISQHHKDTGAPLEVFRLILHPKDYGKTVENMLHVSFLVRDGLMQMKNDENGNPVILPSTKEMKSQAKRSGKQTNTQNVFSLSAQQWKILVDELKITTPMINFH